MKRKVKVRFINGLLGGKTLDVAEATAKRGQLKVIHQSYMPGPETQYLLKQHATHGWIAWRV